MTAQNPTPDDLRAIAKNLRAEGQRSRADVLENAAAELESLISDLQQTGELLHDRATSAHRLFRIVDAAEGSDSGHAGTFKECDALYCERSRAALDKWKDRFLRGGDK